MTDKAPEHELGHSDQTITLFQWVWRAYFKASLVPLLVLEIALITVYFLSNRFASHENVNAIHDLAKQELIHLVNREASGIDHQLESITHATQYLQNYAASVMSGDYTGATDEPDRFAYSPEGDFFTIRDSGGSAVFYSGIAAIDKAKRAKAMRTAALDPALVGIKQAFPLVAQTYLNTYDSLNRIYPYIEVGKQYPPRMDIPTYNFYYEADAKHNPERKAVWTDVYVDPAGQGWMTSCIAPVYSPVQPDFLEGVVGVDVTIASIVDEVKKLAVPWGGYGVLISRSGTILALPQTAEEEWGISGLTQSNYSSAITKNTFRAREYHIDTKPLIAQALHAQPNGFQTSKLSANNLLAWATIPATGWKILIVAPEATILQPATTLAQRLNHIALLMILGMLLFYSLFFLMLHNRALAMVLSISEPLKTIDVMVSDIAAGISNQIRPQFAVAELASTADGIWLMGQQLESVKQARAKAMQELRKRTEQLQVIFDVSPSGYVLVNDQHQIVLSNNAFCDMFGITADQLQSLPENVFLQRVGEQCKTLPVFDDASGTAYRVELHRPKPLSLAYGVKDILLNQGNLVGKVYFFNDITKHEEIDKIKTDFLNHAAHELHTPLASLLGYSELLLAARISEEMQTEIYKLIHQQSAQLVKLINELLDLSKIAERSGEDFNIQPYALTELLSAAVRDFPLPPGRMAINFEPPIFTANIAVDWRRFQQVLFHLLDNAYKFSTVTDTVSVRICEGEDTRTVGIQVIDQGIGMASKELAQAFERFYRADTSGKNPGAGLGLSLSREIIKLHGGTINLDSQPGRGTCVTIYLKTL